MIQATASNFGTIVSGDVVSVNRGSASALPMGYTATVDYAFLGTDTLGGIGTGNDLALLLEVLPAPEPGTAVWGLAMSLFALARRCRVRR